MARLPTVGLIVPPAHGRVPKDGAILYGDSVHFIAEGLGLKSMSPQGYDEVIDRAGSLSKKLTERGAEAIAFMGTSLTFYRGWQFHEELTAGVREASRLPITTMSEAVVEGLKSVDVSRVAVATAYTDTVNKRLRQFLEEAGFEPVVVRGMGIEDGRQVQEVGEHAVADLSDRVMDEARRTEPRADGLLISCGALDTLRVIPSIEERYGLPVVASGPAGFWAAVRLVGLTGRSPGHGRLFELDSPAV